MTFTNSKLVNYTRISPNRTPNRKHAIDTITIHCVSGQCSVETLGSIFAATSKQASSNYGIGYDGRIGMYVEEKDRSWCTSSAANDHRAITIEVASDSRHPYAVNNTAYKALITLLVDICQRNNIKELKWKGDKSLIGQVDKQNMTVHRWFANKACPGEYLYSRHGQIASEVNVRLNNTTSETTKTEPAKPVENNSTATVRINKGDVVSLVKNATYYNGKSIPSWTFGKQWIVASVSGDRVVIDKSNDGKSSINSPVNIKDLKLVTAKTTATTTSKPVENKPTVTTKINKGDVVSLANNATYYNGKSIPSWVLEKEWIVESVSGDRVVIDKSSDGKSSINSPVNIKYLKVVTTKTTTAAVEPILVKVDIPYLNIRKGPGTNYAKTGSYTGRGLFTIVETRTGEGSKSGWGRLQSKSGWISLDFAKRV